MGKQNKLAAIASVGIFALLFTVVFLPLITAHTTTYATRAEKQPVTTIKGLTRIAVVGSTEFIVDAKGNTIDVDANPYGVAIVPSGMPVSNASGALKAGDIVVSDIGNTDTGISLVRFSAKGDPGSLFNTVANPGTKGPSAEAFNTLSGNEWVANVSGNNLQVFKPTGSVLMTINNPLFNKPWGLGFNHATPNPKDGTIAAFLRRM